MVCYIIVNISGCVNLVFPQQNAPFGPPYIHPYIYTSIVDNFIHIYVDAVLFRFQTHRLTHIQTQYSSKRTVTMEVLDPKIILIFFLKKISCFLLYFFQSVYSVIHNTILNLNNCIIFKLFKFILSCKIYLVEINYVKFNL